MHSLLTVEDLESEYVDFAMFDMIDKAVLSVSGHSGSKLSGIIEIAGQEVSLDSIDILLRLADVCDRQQTRFRYDIYSGVIQALIDNVEFSDDKTMIAPLRDTLKMYYGLGRETLLASGDFGYALYLDAVRMNLTHENSLVREFAHFCELVYMLSVQKTRVRHHDGEISIDVICTSKGREIKIAEKKSKQAIRWPDSVHLFNSKLAALKIATDLKDVYWQLMDLGFDGIYIITPEGDSMPFLKFKEGAKKLEQLRPVLEYKRPGEASSLVY